MNNAPIVNATRLQEVIAACAAIGKPLMIWGSPGIGKSESVKQYAKRIEAELIDIRLAQYDSVDLRGLPDVDGSTGLTVWRAPSTLPLEGSNYPTDKPIVLFLDEMMQASNAVQSVAFQIVLDRAVGEHKLLPNVIIIAASNRDTDRAGVGRMLTPLANRFAHVEMVADIEAWRDWALQSDIHPLIVGYLSSRPANLDQFDAAQKSGAKAFATPRSWESVSNALKLFDDNPAMAELMTAAMVGEAVASEFNAFVRNAERIPTLEQIVAGPDKAKVPEDTDALYAVTSMLMMRVSKEIVEPVITYVKRLPMEYQTLWLADVSRSRPDLVAACPAIVQYQISLGGQLS